MEVGTCSSLLVLARVSAVVAGAGGDYGVVDVPQRARLREYTYVPPRMSRARLYLAVCGLCTGLLRVDRSRLDVD
jgi:hypothetical protein